MCAEAIVFSVTTPQPFLKYIFSLLILQCNLRCLFKLLWCTSKVEMSQCNLLDEIIKWSWILNLESWTNSQTDLVPITGSRKETMPRFTSPPSLNTWKRQHKVPVLPVLSGRVTRSQSHWKCVVSVKEQSEKSHGLNQHRRRPLARVAGSVEWTVFVVPRRTFCDSVPRRIRTVLSQSEMKQGPPSSCAYGLFV